MHINDSITGNLVQIFYPTPAAYGFDTTGNLLLIAGGNDSTGQDAGIAFRDEQTNTKWIMGQDATNNKLHIALNAFTTGQKVTILESGNVGINTTSPTDTLDVNGNIKLSSTGTASC